MSEGPTPSGGGNLKRSWPVKICRCLADSLKWISSFNIKIYFLWSAFLYLAAGGIVYAMRSRIVFVSCSDPRAVTTRLLMASSTVEVFGLGVPRGGEAVETGPGGSTPGAVGWVRVPSGAEDAGWVSASARELQAGRNASAVGGATEKAKPTGGGKIPVPAPGRAKVGTSCKQKECDVDLNMLLFVITYVIQAVVAIIVAGGFWYFLRKEEDSMIQLSIAETALGCLCKKLPPLARLFSIVNIVQLTVLTLQAFSSWMPKCSEYPYIRLAVYTVGGVWVFQLLLGVVSKHALHPPPWMHEPMRKGSGLIYQTNRLLSLLGP